VVPGIFGAFQALDALGFGFFDFGHWNEFPFRFGG